MSQSEISSVGSDSAGNSGNDEKGSLIGDRGRTLKMTRTLARTTSTGRSKHRDSEDNGDYPTARLPLLNNL